MASILQMTFQMYFLNDSSVSIHFSLELVSGDLIDNN